MSRARALAFVCVLVAAGEAAPETEVLREEAYNYRFVGRLPATWKRRDKKLVWTFSIDGIPHAHVHFVRQRVEGKVDPAEHLRRRAPHYLFPKAAKDAAPDVRRVDWSGYDAWRYEHAADLQGVACKRRVTVLVVKSIWYELIETVYGAKTEEEDACNAGLRVFRRGFRLLTLPLEAKSEADSTERAEIDSQVYGFKLVKPKGFVRHEVDTAQDPGCRVVFEAQAPDHRRRVRVRLFEYGVRDQFDADEWFGIFFGAFVAHHEGAKQTPTEAPAFRGATESAAALFTGTREGHPIRTEVFVVRGPGGRVFALRIRTRAGAEEVFREAIEEVVKGFELR